MERLRTPKIAKLTLLALTGLASLLSLKTISMAATPAYWDCQNKYTKGAWDFGRAPGACNVKNHMEPASVNSQYKPIVFEESKTLSSERLRYMSDMYPILRDVGTYYLKKRKPTVSAAELNGFLEGLYTLANKESFWTHYRNVGDGVLRYMRGDNGHGHGVMQVDDNSHQVALSQGKGVDMVGNMIYGLDIFYKAWVNSATASCVSTASNYKARARSAWSAYNGGSAKLCRWTDARSPYASFDADFLKMYDAKAWQNFIKDKAALSPIDVKCLTEGLRPCGLPSTTPAPSLVAGRLYKLANGSYCLFKDGGFQCVSAYRDVTCIEALVGQDLGVGEVITDPALIAGKSVKTFDRNVLCASVITGFIPLGKNVTVKKAINLRSTASTGTILSVLKTGESFNILGFEVQGWSKQDRYYRVKSGALDGYFYAGTKSDHLAWAEATVAPAAPTPTPTPKSNSTVPTPSPTPAAKPIPSTVGLAKAGQFIRIVNANGINLRTTAGGELIEAIPAQTVLEVQAVSIQGNNSSVYYKVNHLGRTGFLFAGTLEPQNTLGAWSLITTKPEAPGPKTYQLSTSVDYRYLRMCGGEFCFPSSNVVMPNVPVTIDEPQGSWVRVTNTQTGASGWLRAADLVEVRK